MKLGGYVAQFLVPFFAEAADEWSFQKFIDGEVKATALFTATLANVPAVVVQANAAVAECLFANRVEGAANRLAEFAASLPES